MKHVRMLALTICAALAALVLVVPAAAQAKSLAWENTGYGFQTGYMTFTHAGLTFGCDVQIDGEFLNEEGQGATFAAESTSFGCGKTNQPNCVIESATGEVFPWVTGYTGTLESGITALTTGIKISFDFSESCKSRGIPDFYLSGSLYGEYEQGGNEFGVTLNNSQYEGKGLSLNGTSALFSVFGELYSEGVELQEV